MWANMATARWPEVSGWPSIKKWKDKFKFGPQTIKKRVQNPSEWSNKMML